MKLEEAYRRIKHAVAPTDMDPPRPHLRAVRVDVDAQGPVLIATDGHRMSFARLDADLFTLGALKNQGTLFIQSTLPSAEQFVRDVMNPSRFLAFDTEFPRWRQAVPADGDLKSSILVDAPALMAAVEKIREANEAQGVRNKTAHAEALACHILERDAAIEAFASAKTAAGPGWRTSYPVKEARHKRRGAQSLLTQHRKSKFHIPDSAALIFSQARGELRLVVSTDSDVEVKVTAKVQVTGSISFPNKKTHEVIVWLNADYLYEALAGIDGVVTIAFKNKDCAVRIDAPESYEIIMPLRR